MRGIQRRSLAPVDQSEEDPDEFRAQPAVGAKATLFAGADYQWKAKKAIFLRGPPFRDTAKLLAWFEDHPVYFCLTTALATPGRRGGRGCVVVLLPEGNHENK